MATYILPTNVVVMVSLPPRDQRSSVGEATGFSPAIRMAEDIASKKAASGILGKAGA